MPGWLTTALLDDLVQNPLSGLEDALALLQPSQMPSSAALYQRHPNISRCVAYDLAEEPPPAATFEGADCLLHTAAVIHVRRTSDWYRINTEGTLKLARAAKAAGVRRFVLVSSNAAGGRATSATHQLSEDEEPRPLSHYGRSKLLAEQGLRAMEVPGSFETVILRPSMFYGPPVPDRHIEVYRRILHGRMPVFGDGLYSRSITYIDSLVQACRLALTVPGAAGQTYYIVDDAVYTTQGIVEAMAKALGCSLRVLRLPRSCSTLAYTADRILARTGIYQQEVHLVGEANWHVGISCDKAKRELGYRPVVRLQEGMQRAVDWCRENGKL